MQVDAIQSRIMRGRLAPALHHQVLTWAMRENVRMPIATNNLLQFRWARIGE